MGEVPYPTLALTGLQNVTLGGVESQLIRAVQREKEKMNICLIPALCLLLWVVPIGQAQQEARGARSLVAKPKQLLDWPLSKVKDVVNP